MYLLYNIVFFLFAILYMTVVIHSHLVFIIAYYPDLPVFVNDCFYSIQLWILSLSLWRIGSIHKHVLLCFPILCLKWTFLSSSLTAGFPKSLHADSTTQCKYCTSLHSVYTRTWMKSLPGSVEQNILLRMFPKWLIKSFGHILLA